MFNPERPPEISAQRWINSDKKRSLKSEKGKVIVVAIWQLTCPGSQKYGLKFAEQSPEKVEAFLAENDITIPVALDKPDGENLPETMRAYELQGTPAMLIFDRQGRLRRHYLGAVDDLRIGAEVMALLIEDKESPREMSIAIESKLAAALVDPEAHSHDHEHGDACGCGHDHSHDHDHDHHHNHEHGEPGHVHGPDCKHLMAEKPDKDGVKPAEAEAQSPATPAPSPGSGLSRKERPHVRESVRPRAAVVYEIIQSSARRRSAKKSTRNARRADAQDFLAPPESRFSPLYKSSGEKRQPWSSG